MLKPVKVTPRGDWYKVKSPADVTPKLIDSIDWPGDKPYLNFVFPKQKLDAQKTLRFKLSNKYLVSINCISGGRGIKLPAKPVSFAGI